MMRRPFYVLLIPLTWMIVDVINFQYPGDEYGGWAVGSLPGLWILLLLKNEGSPLSLLPYLVAAGGAVMAALGWAMDRLRVPVLPWAILWVVVAVALETHALAQYPSWERAMAKNGSPQAYILPAVSLGLLASTILMIATMCPIRLLHGSQASGTKHPDLAKPDGFLEV